MRAARLRDLGCVAAVALAPFESDVWAIDLPGIALRLTALEAAIGLAIVGAVATLIQDRQTRGWPRPTGLGRAILVLPAVGLVAAALAPEAVRTAWLGAARLLGSALLAWAFALSLRDAAVPKGKSSRHAPRSPIATALMLAMGLVVGLGALEQLGGDGWFGPRGAALDEALLGSFRPKASVTEAGARRLTASFGHANLAASWLALVLPLLAGAALERRHWRRALALIALPLLALAATLSRAGLIAGLAAIAVLVAFLAFAQPRRSVDFVRGRPRWLPLGLTATAVVTLVLLLARSPSFEDRWGLRPRPLIAAEYTLTAEREPGGGSRLVATATNRGSLCWRPWGRDRHVFDLRLPPGTGGEASAAAPLARDAAIDRPDDGGPLRRALTHRVCTDEAATAIWQLPVEVEALRGAEVELVHHGMRRFAELGVRAATLDGATAASDGGAAATAAGAPAAAGADDAGLIPLGRATLWRAALTLWMQRPVLGHGPDTFRVRKASVIAAPGLDDREHANNLLLEVLADMGAAGALALAWIAAAVAGAALRSWRNDDLPGIAASAACVAFAVHGIADSPLFSWGPMVLLALALGMLIGRTSDA